MGISSFVTLREKEQGRNFWGSDNGIGGGGGKIRANE